MNELDKHGQPYHAGINHMRNMDKLVNNLVGIIDGIVADGVVDEREVVYLDAWIKDASLLDGVWSFNAIKSLIEAVLSDGHITKDELDHLKDALPKVQAALMDIPFIDFYSEESDKLLLEGLCKGVIANRKLTDSEIRYASWWLGQNGMLRSRFPGKELYLLMEKILEDGVITEDERDELAAAIQLYTGDPLSIGVTDGMSTLFPVDKNPTIDLPGRSVCFTGQFLSGTRKQCEDMAIALGATPRKSVTKDLDYLVIGALSSRDWRYSNHGRKIEKVMDYRANGKTKAQIIHEENWAEHIKETGRLLPA